MQKIIETIIESPKEHQSRLLNQLIIFSVVYATTRVEFAFKLNPKQSFIKQCQLSLEEIRKLPPNKQIEIIGRELFQNEDDIENSDEEKQNFFKRELMVSPQQQCRKPTPHEDSLISSLLQRLKERENMQVPKKKNLDSLQEFLTYNTPHEVWRAIQDIKGSYYFFEVFENQIAESGINYSNLNKMMMCSKAYEREYTQYKRILEEQQQQFQELIHKEMQNLTQINYVIPKEPFCLVVKDELIIDPPKCNCDQRGLRILFEFWRLVTQIKSTHPQFKQILFTQLQRQKQQFQNQLTYADDVVEYMKQRHRELLIKIKYQEQQIKQLNSEQMKIEIMNLKQQLQKLQIEKAQLQVRLTHFEQTFIKLKNQEKRVVQDLLEQTDKQMQQVNQLLKVPKNSSIGCNTDFPQSFFDLDSKLELKNIQSRIESFKIQLLNDQSTQTENFHQQPILIRRKPKSVQKRPIVSSHIPKREEPIPVFNRLFNDSQEKRNRQLELSTRILDNEKSHWEEILSLLHYLHDESKNQVDKLKIKKQIMICTTTMEQPQLKFKERVPQNFMENLLNNVQNSKRVALNQMVEGFQSVLKVNKINRSVDNSLQFTI